MNKSSLALMIATTLLLAACGGKDDKNNTPVDPQRPSNDNSGRSNNDAYHGTAFAIPNGATFNSAHHAKALNSTRLGVVHIDGKHLPAQQTGIYSGGLPNIRSNSIQINGVSYKNFLVSGHNYRNSRFGYITHDNTDYIFSQGAFTTNMPNQGIVEYDGDAAVGRNGVAGVADADFTVNFGNKTVSGRIKAERDSNIQFNPIYLTATINGSHFSGSTNSAGVSTAGHFYGDNARELGGIFHDSTQNLSGSYGAVRDND